MDGKLNFSALKVVRRDIGTLRPNKRNARTHSDEQVAQLVASIQEWGWTQPILADEKGEVIAGHGRLLAAKSLGLKAVPVIVADGWTKAQKRAYLVADNQLALNAGWDMDLLRVEIGEIGHSGFDVGLLGFGGDFLADLLADRTLGLTDPDEAPPAPEHPATDPGDIWLLGNHRVLCGDSTQSADIERAAGGKQAALLWTDPPYGVDYVGKTKSALTIENDGSKGLPSLLAAAWAAVTPALEMGAPFYIARPAGVLSLVFGNTVAAAGWKLHQELQWVKDSMVLGHSDYHLRHETIMYGWLPGPGRSGRGRHDGSRWFGSNSETSVFEIPRPKRSTDHPTGKPVELVRRHIANSSAPSAFVLDPFLGSGTTLIAAEMEGRTCLGLELSPAYCDVIVKRWQAFTGNEATLEGDGRTFEKVENDRRPEFVEAAE